MRKSEDIAELTKALVKFQAEVKNPKLNGSVKVQTSGGSSYSFKYATIGEIKEIIREPLSKNGLAYSQIVEEDGAVTTILMHESGQWVRGRAKLGNVEGKKAQEVGSLITYTKRYSLSAILGLVTEEDDDGNTYDGNSYKYKKKATAKGVGIGIGEQEATSPQMELIKKLAGQHGFELKSSYTKKEASDLISEYMK